MRCDSKGLYEPDGGEVTGGDGAECNVMMEHSHSSGISMWRNMAMNIYNFMIGRNQSFKIAPAAKECSAAQEVVRTCWSWRCWKSSYVDSTVLHGSHGGM